MSKSAATGMRPIRDTIPLDDARELMLEACPPIQRTERVTLLECAGRVVAADVVSQHDVPPFNRAAMDGYAVTAADTFGAGAYDPKTLRCIERVFTGEVPRETVTPGTCIEIATGAPMPEGADAVVMVEETDKDQSGQVRVFTPVYPRQNVGRRGADIVPGQTLARAGDILTPSRIGAIAAVGVAEVEVFARPRITILSTGNEIIAPGAPLGPGQIYDINRFTLAAIVTEHGGDAVVLETAADTVVELRAAVDAALDADLLVFSGGSSVGERDLILDVIDESGEVLFHGVAVKPGKPTVFGRIGKTPVLGMPGYPTSCLSNGYMMLVPAVRRLAHLPPHTPREVQLPVGHRIVSTTGRHQFYTVRIENGVAMPVFKASGDITSMSQADGYIEIPAQTDIVEKGEMVAVKLFQ